MPGLWTEGARAYVEALRHEYDAARGRLQTRIEHCVEPLERQALETELEELKRDFQKRLKGVSRCLFGAR
jgi:hypothetical protein